MTTPAPERTTGRRRVRSPGPTRPQLRLTWLAWLLSWLVPTALLGALLLGLSFVPGLNAQGYLSPLIPVVAVASLAVGLPGTLAVGWLLRYQRSLATHVLGYTLVGLLYGPIVLITGVGGLIPMLIPLVGFPAAIVLGVGRWAVQPLAVISGGAEEDEPSVSAQS